MNDLPSINTRAAAYIKDYVILAIISFIIMFLIYMLSPQIVEWGVVSEDDQTAPFIFMGMLVFPFNSYLFFTGLLNMDISYSFCAFCIIIIYTVYYFFAQLINQATICQKADGLKVISLRQEKLTIFSILLRSVIKAVLPFTFFLPCVTIFFTQKKQALHDIIAGSAVVFKERT